MCKGGTGTRQQIVVISKNLAGVLYSYFYKYTHPYTKHHFPVLSKGYKSFFKTTFMTLVTVNAHKDAFVFLKLLYVFR